MGNKCFICNKDMNGIWQVEYIDNGGEINFAKCCSENCCDYVSLHWFYVHEKRSANCKDKGYLKLK